MLLKEELPGSRKRQTPQRVFTNVLKQDMQRVDAGDTEMEADERTRNMS